MDPDELLRQVVGTLERLQIPYFVTGSMATILYGEPRFTNDIDIVAELGLDRLPALVAAFPPPAFYLSAESAARAVRGHGQFNIIHPASGLKIDLMVPAMTDHDCSRFRRIRRLHPAAGYEANFASPEDVILKKLQVFAMGGSDKHLRDIAGVLSVSPDTDRGYIGEWAERLGVGELWRAVNARQSRPD